MPRRRRVDRSGLAFALLGCVAIFGPLAYLAWPSDHREPSAAEPETTGPDVGSTEPTPAAVDRDAPLLLQPVLVWADESITVQGTGFTVDHPRGTFAVTSSHYIVPSETPLHSVAFGSLPALDKLGRVEVAWGPIGPCDSESADDMRDDYLVMPTPPLPGLQPLQLDPRDEIPVGEAVWFPDKDDGATAGHVVRTGRVTRSSRGALEVALDQPIVLESQSGTPVLSEASNRVIGILGGADSEQGQRLYFAPASVLRAVMDDEQREPVPLSEALMQWIPGPDPAH